MGLRSRRGSAATTRTTRASSNVSNSPLVEQPEDTPDPPQAGPSRQSTALPTSIPTDTLPVAKQGEGDTESIRTVNPKSSSSWRRWNRPAPSFPRSVSTSREKGKGKQIGEAHTGAPSRANTDAADGRRHVDPAINVPALGTPLPSSNTPSIRGRVVDSRPSKQPSSSVETSASLPNAQQSPPHSRSSEQESKQAEASAGPTVPQTEQQRRASIEATIIPASTSDTAVPTENRGWRAYIWGSRPVPPPEAVDPPPAEPSLPVEQPPKSQSPAIEASPTTTDGTMVKTPEAQEGASATPAAEPAPDAIAPAATTTAPPTQPGWSSYLMSFVTTPKPPASNAPDTSHAVVPTDSSADQRPIPAETPTSTTPSASEYARECRLCL